MHDRRSFSQLVSRANYLGYDLEETGATGIYRDRKGKVYQLRDRRTGKVVAVYSTLQPIEKMLTPMEP